MRKPLWKRFLSEFAPRRTGAGWRLGDIVVVALILLAVLTTILQTEEALSTQYSAAFLAADVLCGVAFSIEYLLRVLAAGQKPSYQGFTGRLRYMVTPLALLDFLALLPFILLLSMNESVFARIFRLLRILTLFKSARLFNAFDLLRRAFKSRAYELAISFSLSMIVLFVSATCLYFAERTAQPEAFGSIPRAMWASVITLTTVGYGDTYPVTALGRAIAGLTAFLAIALVALPAGILAAAFSDEIQRLSRSNPEEDEKS